MAKPYRTSEVRWFLPGAMPLAVTQWFAQALDGDWAESVLLREDVYLLVPGRDDAGLKFRKDKIQLKLRGGSRPFSLLGGRIEGAEVDWERHSWGGNKRESDLAHAFSGQGGEGRQVVVSKKRRQRAYRLVPGEAPRSSSPGEVLPLVLIEVTEVAFTGFSGWSLGLEVIDPKTAPQGRLQRAVAELLRDFPILPLKRCDSLDYPELIRLRAS